MADAGGGGAPSPDGGFDFCVYACTGAAARGVASAYGAIASCAEKGSACPSILP